MDFILEWWKAFIAIACAIVAAGALAWLRSTFVSKKEFEQHKQRLTDIEKTIEDLPSSEDLHELDKRLIEVGGKIDSLTPQLNDVKKLTDLLMENELRGARNGD